MKSRNWIMAIMMALALSGATALAATLSNGSGQSCGDFEGTWHFVNNQTGGAAAGMLTANFSSGSFTVGALKVNASSQHFYVMATGTLTSASTNLPGRLVLSDFSCDSKEPPPCDPKTQTCK